jgi:hypothetical protein
MAIPDGGYSRLVAAQTGNNATLRRSIASKARLQDMTAAAKVDAEDE